jgi:hypothetical protein
MVVLSSGDIGMFAMDLDNNNLYFGVMELGNKWRSYFWCKWNRCIRYSDGTYQPFL